LIRNINIIFLSLFINLLFINYSAANFEEKLFNKFETINTLSFDFNQKIGEKIEFGNCFIKYPLLMRCEYPKKKKSIITNGKKFAIVKKRYKKIYYYPLEKTPLFYLLKKENILNLIKNYKPTDVEKNIIRYEITDENKNKLKIFFNKESLELLGWKTIDAYTNEVNFLIRNIKINILIKNEFFIIPKIEDL